MIRTGFYFVYTQKGNKYCTRGSVLEILWMKKACLHEGKSGKP